MDKESTLQSRTLGALGLFILLLILSAAIPSSWFTKKTPSKHSPINLRAIIEASKSAHDTNHDGAVTWQELIEQSFDDATSSIAQLKKDFPPDPKVLEELNDPNNLTSSLTKKLFVASSLMEGKESTDEAAKNRLLSRMIQEEATKIAQTKYAVEDITLTKGDSKGDLKTYGNAVAPIIKNLINTTIITNDLAAINSFTQTRNPSDLAEIKKNNDRVGPLITKLLATPVPPSLALQHLVIINRLASYKDILNALAGAGSDPLRASLVMGNYTDAVVSVGTVPAQLKNLFDSKNVVFSSNEPGYIFTSGYTYK
jgi:hypothetical protein